MRARADRVHVFALKQPRHLAVLKHHTATVRCVDFFGTQLVSGGGDGHVALWDVYRKSR